MDYEQLRSALISKGEATEDRSVDHVFFYIEIGGKRHRATKLSHGARGQISGPLLGIISRQMRLTTRELRALVACTLGRDQWIEFWQQRGVIWRG